jgi:hypothetical protein
MYASMVIPNFAKKRGNTIKIVTGLNLPLRVVFRLPADGGVFGEPIKAFPKLSLVATNLASKNGQHHSRCDRGNPSSYSLDFLSENEVRH